MSNKINFDDLISKKKELQWNMSKNKDTNTYTVKAVLDCKDEVEFTNVPGQYVKEDGLKDAKELNEEESVQLVTRRMQSLIDQLNMAIFTTKFYGANISGLISSGKKPDAS